ncbi:MAG: hypothetical protein IT385_18970 [Deltaproteobacteria bacterium]|nr:hypothetical protein [Deltaproteobacteria bacterium]
MIATELGRSIRERVQGQGDLAGQAFPGWRQRGKRRYAVSPRYPDGIQGQLGPSGAEWFESRAAYHAQRGTRPGTYNVTGGMWAGLSVVVEGRFRASLRFRGRSEGADPGFRRASRGKGKGKIRVRPLKINNALKAASILRSHGVNVLALSEPELERVGKIVVGHMGLAVGSQLGVTWQRPPDRVVQP